MEKKALILASVASMIDQFNMPNIEILQNAGYIVHVVADFDNPGTITNERADNLKKRLSNIGVRIVQVAIPRSINPFKIWTAYRKIKSLIREENYKLIHCHSPIGGAICRMASRKKRKSGTKVLYTAHGFHFYKGAPIKNWLIYYPIEKWLSKYTDVLITINKEDYIRAKTFKAKLVKYVPGVGIDTISFARSEAIYNSKRIELALNDENFVLLSVGELNENKNHIVVLEALVELKKQGKLSNIRYLICGKGPLGDVLLKKTEEYGITKNVCFLGYRSDVKDILRAADLFVFMSQREGLSVALMEAMASGLPIICSNIRGNIDLIENGINGIVADNNPAAVAEEIKKLMDDKQFREQLALEATKKVKEFDKEYVQKIMRELYI